MKKNEPWKCPICHHDGESDDLGAMWESTGNTGKPSGSFWYEQTFTCPNEKCGAVWTAEFKYEGLQSIVAEPAKG